MDDASSNPSAQSTWSEWFRECLASIVVVVSIVGVAVLGGMAIQGNSANSKDILTGFR